jgi:hypothetical protein
MEGSYQMKVLLGLKMHGAVARGSRKDSSPVAPFAYYVGFVLGFLYIGIFLCSFSNCHHPLHEPCHELVVFLFQVDRIGEGA